MPQCKWVSSVGTHKLSDQQPTHCSSLGEHRAMRVDGGAPTDAVGRGQLLRAAASLPSSAWRSAAAFAIVSSDTTTHASCIHEGLMHAIQRRTASSTASNLQRQLVVACAPRRPDAIHHAEPRFHGGQRVRYTATNWSSRGSLKWVLSGNAGRSPLKNLSMRLRHAALMQRRARHRPGPTWSI